MSLGLGCRDQSEAFGCHPGADPGAGISPAQDLTLLGVEAKYAPAQVARQFPWGCGRRGLCTMSSDLCLMRGQLKPLLRKRKKEGKKV